MVTLASLWIPALLSSMIVFVASSIIHMASPGHESDCPRLAVFAIRTGTFGWRPRQSRPPR